LEQYLADQDGSVGANASNREGRLVEIHAGGADIRGPRWALRRIADRWRFLGGLAFSVFSLGACFLVARHLSDASWPLDGGHMPLVLLAGGLYLASFGFRAFGWHELFPSHERPDRARCLASCGAAAASGVVLPFRLDYVVKIVTLRRLGGVTLGLETIAVSIVTLGMIDAVAMLPLALAALATSGALLRAPLVVVVLFCVGCLGIIVLGQRVQRLPLVGRWERLHKVYRRVADSTRFSRPTLIAGVLLLGCWTSRALGSTFLLSALGVPFSPTLALAVMCLSAATAILPITAGGAVAGMGTTAGVLYALDVSKGVAVNFALASGLLLTGAALVAAALGLAGSLLLTFRARRESGTPVLLPRLGLLPDPPALAEGLSPVQATRLELPHSKRRQSWL
jgi:lysylphosphatidylglycerol synthase-like protein